MTLKAEFVSFVRETLGIPLVGVAPPDDLLPDDREKDCLCAEDVF